MSPRPRACFALSFLALLALLLGGCSEAAETAAHRQPLARPGAPPHSLAVAASTGQQEAVPQPTAARTSTSTLPLSTTERRSLEVLRLVIYYPRTFGPHTYLVPEQHLVPATRAPARAAVNELLHQDPLYPGGTRPFPDGTRLLGLNLTGDGTITVNLSKDALRGTSSLDAEARRYRLQALAWTLTEFQTVKRVRLLVEGQDTGEVGGDRRGDLRGEPARLLTRDPATRLAPIALTEPTPNAVVTGSRLVVKGEASVFEGTVSLHLRTPAGKVVTQGVATAERSAPGRGAFSAALVFEPPARRQEWTLEAFTVSPEDASVTYMVAFPVLVLP